MLSILRTRAGLLTLLGALLVAVAAVLIWGYLTPTEPLAEADAGPGLSLELATAHASHLVGQQATFYKSPSCGCCDVYAETLEASGVQVTVISDTNRMYDAKRRFGVPAAAASCHTFTLGGYVIEGHVPMEALEALLAERPAIDGIVLPGMPIGTPGMPGVKTAPFEVQSLQGGKLAPFMTL